MGSRDCWCFNLGKCYEVEEKIYDCMCKNCLSRKKGPKIKEYISNKNPVVLKESLL
jgi:hypothetical protein